MKLFISYSHNDIARVKELAEYLQHAGHYGWYDHELLPGQKWEIELKTQVESCDVFIYVASRDSLKSEWCKREHRIAKKAKISVIPVLIDTKAASLMKKELGEIQYSDFCDGFKPDKIAKLLGGLTKIAEELAIKKTKYVKANMHSKGILVASAELVGTIADRLLDTGRFKSKYLESLLEQAGEYVDRKQWSKSAAKLDAVIVHEQRIAEVYVLRAWCYTELGYFSKALVDFEKALEIDPKCVEGYGLRGCTYIQMKELDNALPDLSEAIRLGPTTEQYFNRSSVYIMLRQNENALEVIWKFPLVKMGKAKCTI